MCGGSGLGSSSGFSSSPCPSSPSNTLFPTPTASMTMGGDDSDGVTALVSATLAMAVLSLLFALIMTFIVAVVLYHLIKLKGEVRRLRYSGGGGAAAKAENGSSQLVAINLLSGQLPNTGTGDESLDQKPAPLPPAVQTGTTLPQMIPKPQASEEDLAHTAPARIPSPRDAYDNVNLKNSILPPELRTEENLEGRPLDLAQVRQLEEAERRQEQSYEEIEMSLKRKEEAVATVRQMADMSGKKGEESDDEVYTNPVDAVAEEAVKAAAKTGSLKKKKKQKEGKKSETESVSPVAHEPGLYTSVFDQLPSGEKEVVAKQSKTGGRGNSKSPTPPTNKKTFEGGGGGRRDFCGYEDMEDEMFATSAPCKESPLLTGAGELDDPMTSPQDENEKMKLTKRYSHPAAPRRDREAMKEMVEINPRSKKPVTLSSGRRKDRLQRGSGEGVDGEREGVDGEEEEVVVNGDTKSRSAGSSPNTKAKEFNIADKGDVPQDSYAMVDLAGKMRYRAESDSMKREGSGVPKRYTVKERPPEPEESTAVTVNP